MAPGHQILDGTSKMNWREFATNRRRLRAAGKRRRLMWSPGALLKVLQQWWKVRQLLIARWIAMRVLTPEELQGIPNLQIPTVPQENSTTSERWRWVFAAGVSLGA